MPQLSERSGRVIIDSPMRSGTRVLLACAGLVPLLAPYEMIFTVEWSDYLNVFFLAAAVVSAGALTVSLLLFFAAVAGLSTRMVFDAGHSTFTYFAASPFVRLKARSYPLSAVAEVAVGIHEWSDGPPTYCLKVRTTDGASYESATSTSHQEIEGYMARVSSMLPGADISHE